MATVGILFLAVIALAVAGPAQAPLCQPGWRLKQETANSFNYNQNGVHIQWTGLVQLHEWYNGNCDVTIIEIRYVGNPSGGTAVLDKLTFAQTVFMSFTIQWPSGFTDYNNVATNAVGDLYWWTPAAGQYSGYHVETLFNINAVLADEYVIVTDDTASHTISGVQVYFRLPLTFLGRTVVAEIFGGFCCYPTARSLINIFIPT